MMSVGNQKRRKSNGLYYFCSVGGLYMRSYLRRNSLLFNNVLFVGVLRMSSKDMDRLLDEVFAKVFGERW